jgi:DegV family protein with EDD domain
MNDIKLLADSTSDLSEELIQKHDIGIIPLYVNFGLQSYQDNVEITAKELYAKVEKGGILPTTSAPTPDNYVAEFEKHIESGKDVIYIGISSKLSSSYQNACTAALRFPPGRIRVIDSLNLSSGIGLLVMTAADCIQKGLDSAKTEATVKSKIGKVETAFVLNTVEYLYKGGRCSGLQMFFSSLLKIHPVIKVTDGSMHAAAKVRGGRRQMLEHLLACVKDDMENVDPLRLIVANSECPEDARWLKDKLSQLKIVDEIVLTEASCVISTHCGPKTLGIFYLKK